MRVRRSVGSSIPVPDSVILDLRERVPPLLWAEIFPSAPERVEIEIGTGKGMFLRRAAESLPRTGFLGVERAAKWLALCAARLARDGRSNVRLVRTDAFDLLARWVPIGSVDVIHVYFPDPWPKKRHAKRRLLGPVLYDLAARALRPGGTLAIATDVDWYFAEAAEALGRHAGFRPLPMEPDVEADIRTHYARKYAEQGRALFFIRFERTAAAPPELPPPPSRPRRNASTDLPSAP